MQGDNSKSFMCIDVCTFTNKIMHAHYAQETIIYITLLPSNRLHLFSAPPRRQKRGGDNDFVHSPNACSVAVSQWIVVLENDYLRFQVFHINFLR